ncbi:hypothetical protein IL252_14535 (plasmid) [Halomicrobium sp. IBSBa]|uniref:hypothetical protein n=1 Tax=Halomicrobium sp. IBSBa TaxID=2778916 RepID=UPI001ABF257A|nr:hypothetical protein [Halomicrobium sp. IBSBa]MBO4249034.1 hypothetical protein [Halomicrobium sp. IBSBa]
MAATGLTVGAATLSGQAAAEERTPDPSEVCVNTDGSIVISGHGHYEIIFNAKEVEAQVEGSTDGNTVFEDEDGETYLLAGQVDGEPNVGEHAYYTFEMSRGDAQIDVDDGVEVEFNCY